jgi:tetratricopeptide (TPR) repeat protein
MSMRLLFVIALLLGAEVQAQSNIKLEALRMDTVATEADFFFTFPFDLADRNSANRFFSEATYQFQKGDLMAASSLMRRAIQKKPNRPEYHILQSYILTEMGESRQAIKHAETAVEMLPDDWKALYCLALARFGGGDFLGASIEYSKALEIDPSQFQLFEGRGHAKSKMNDQLGALEDFNLAIMLKPAYIKAYYGRAMANYKLGKYQAAVVDFTSVLMREPDNAQAYYYRGVSRRMMGDMSTSCSDFDKAAKLGMPEAAEELRKNCFR